MKRDTRGDLLLCHCMHYGADQPVSCQDIAPESELAYAQFTVQHCPLWQSSQATFASPLISLLDSLVG